MVLVVNWVVVYVLHSWWLIIEGKAMLLDMAGDWRNLLHDRVSCAALHEGFSMARDVQWRR